ncbi:MAG: ubiquinol-cytochrome c reductase iron-sulfur subunit [Acidimicrobiia bacterium]
MGIAIAIIVILLVAAATIFLTASRRRASTGTLSRETKSRDQSLPVVEGEAVPASTELEATGRERSDETRQMAGDVPAVRPSGDVVKWEPVDEEELGVTRRAFLNRAVLTVTGFSAAALGIGILGFLWPTSAGGFGAKINAGNLDDILAEIEEKREPKYIPDARTYLRPYPGDALANAEKVASYKPIMAGLEAGIVALWQRCVHLGCRVPWCTTSQWFECPCHGSKYNGVGEKRDGPAPRGLDRFPVEITSSNDVIINTGIIVTGPPIGTNTTNQSQEGPSCI